MPTTQPSALVPTREITTSKYGIVTIRELTWGEHLVAVRRLTDTVMKVLGKDGKIALDSKAVVNAIGEQEQLVQYLLETAITTPAAKTPEAIKALPTRDMLVLLGAIVELNLSEEIVGAAKKVGAQMAGALGLNQVSVRPSTS